MLPAGSAINAPQQQQQQQQQQQWRRRPPGLRAHAGRPQLRRAAASGRCRAAAADGDQHGGSSRRSLLATAGGLALASAAATVLPPPPPSHASVTVSLRPGGPPKAYTLANGAQVSVPPTWALAYDRSGDKEQPASVPGRAPPSWTTLALFGDFKTVDTLSVLRVPLAALPPADAEAAGGSADEQLVDRVLSDVRNNASTYGFALLSGPTRRAAPAAGADAGGGGGGGGGGDVFVDGSYELAVCRGLIEEGAGGRRRCVGPKDRDLQIVARRFRQALLVRGEYVYVVRASATAERFPEVDAAAAAAVESFRLPPDL